MTGERMEKEESATTHSLTIVLRRVWPHICQNEDVGARSDEGSRVLVLARCIGLWRSGVRVGVAL